MIFVCVFIYNLLVKFYFYDFDLNKFVFVLIEKFFMCSYNFFGKIVFKLV